MLMPEKSLVPLRKGDSLPELNNIEASQVPSSNILRIEKEQRRANRRRKIWRGFDSFFSTQKEVIKEK